jgi:LacI family transcriptional regulator
MFATDGKYFLRRSHGSPERPTVKPVPKVALLLETSTEYGRGLLRGIVRYTRLHGPWSVWMSPGHLEQVLPKAKSWGGTGIIARIRSPKMAKLIRATGLPVVASSLHELASHQPGKGFGEIRTDSPGIARMAAGHLLERGLRHFGFCGFHACRWSCLREQAFTERLAEEGVECRTHQVQVANWLHEPGWIQTWEREQPILGDWLRSLPKPVGLMACNDSCGREVLQACGEAGLRIPDDVAVVGVDNDALMCELSDPPLSSVALNLEQAGYDAARLLDSLMSGQSIPEQIVLVKPTFVVSRRSSEVMAQGDPCVVAALRFIKDRAGQAIGVPDVVNELRVSRRTLERRFASMIGHSILSEVIHCRLERAKRLLLETDLPVYRIAAGSGFASVKTFNRSFRRAEGRTATLFRDQAIGAPIRQARPRDQ